MISDIHSICCLFILMLWLLGGYAVWKQEICILPMSHFFSTVQRDCCDFSFASVFCIGVNHPPRVGGFHFWIFLLGRISSYISLAKPEGLWGKQTAEKRKNKIPDSARRCLLPWWRGACARVYDELMHTDSHRQPPPPPGCRQVRLPPRSTWRVQRARNRPASSSRLHRSFRHTFSFSFDPEAWSQGPVMRFQACVATVL